MYTEDVVLGVITKLKNCMQEMLADGYKVKLDGIGTLYPVLTSSGVADAKDFSAQENITRVGISFLADQSKKSQYKASAMKQGTILSTKLYSELTGEDENPSAGSGQASGSGSGSGTGSITTGVAAPTIGGEAAFTTSTQVTMSGPDGAEIRYTTDGSTPTASSTLYTEAITVSSSVTLKAIAIKDGQSSEVTTKQFVKSDGGADDPSGFEGA